MKKLLLLSSITTLLFSSFDIKADEAFPREKNTYRIMSYNVRNGMGIDNVTDYQRIIDVIRKVNPDIIAVQELDSVTNRSKGNYVLNEFAKYVGMYATYGSAISYDGGKYGVGVLSKEKPLAVKNIPLPGKEEKRTLLIVEFEKYVMCCSHWSLTKEDREASIVIINNAVKDYTKPVFLAGDLNSEPESDAIEHLSENWKMLSNPKQFTFPADKPRETIDYIFGYLPKGQVYSVFKREVVDEPLASDHRPLFVDVRIKKQADEVMRTIPYLQNPSETGMTVMWITNVPCRSWVEYGTDPSDMKRVRTFIEGEMVANNTINKIRLEDLQPGTKYYYRAVSQEITQYRSYYKEFGDTVYSDISSFETWNPAKKDFTVLVFNDIHKNFKMLDTLAMQVKNIDYDLVIFNGDCLDDVERESDIVESVNYYAKHLKGSQVPSIYMRGNHETRGEYSVLLWNYLDQKGGHSFGSFTLGDARFVFLDNGEDKPDTHWVYYGMNDFEQHRINQKLFLEKEIASKEFKSANNRILIHHIPIFGGNQDRYNPCKPLWESVLAKGKFDISLNAHTHRYEYIPVGEDKNTYPVVIGGGNRTKSATLSILRKRGNNLNLQVIDAYGNEKLKLDF
ncbi:MAG TPA: endonuclease [Dysgonomonas sp.]|nr:endonuclease [Dysgonomonas sp.]